MALLAVGAVVGSIAAFHSGESIASVADRLFRFTPAVLLFTLLWKYRKPHAPKVSGGNGRISSE
jgi:hypothetical protein